MREIYLLQFSSKPCVRMRKVVSELERSGYKVYFCGVDRGDKGKLDSSSIYHFGVSAKRGSLFKIFSLPIYVVSVFLFFLKKKPSRLYCADLEAGIVGALYAFFSNTREKKVNFVYDVLDTYSERYKIYDYINKLINVIETKVANASTLLIHVDENRVKTLKTERDNYIVVRNVPSVSSLPTLKEKKSPLRKQPIKILISGGIYDHRGVRKFIELMSDYEFKKNVKVDVIGFGDSKLIDLINKNDNFLYIGYVDSSKAQSLSADADIILSLYDPTSEINRLACPNKVYDGAANATFVLVNQEVINDSSFYNYPNILTCNYYDSTSIKESIYSIYDKDASKLYEFSTEFRKTSLWEKEFEPVVKHFDLIS